LGNGANGCICSAAEDVIYPSVKMQAVVFPLEDALALHESIRYGFPDPPSRREIMKQGTVAPTMSCGDSPFPSSKRNNTNNVKPPLSFLYDLLAYV